MFKKFRLEIIAALISLAVNMSLSGIYQFFPNQGAWFIGSAVVVTSMIVFHCHSFPCLQFSFWFGATLYLGTAPARTER